MSASIPLRTTFTSVLLAVLPSSIRHNPAPKEIQQATSLHVFTFSFQGELLLAESEGSHDMEEWDSCYDTAERICRNSEEGMELEGQMNLEQWVREVVEEKVDKEQRWRVVA